MSLDEIIQNRRSVREFNNEEVSDEIVREIVQAGLFAPSACNVCGTRVIYIKDKQIIKRIIKLQTAHFINENTKILCIVYDNSGDNREYKETALSAAAAIENMLLKATQLNIATCWVANLPRQKFLKEILNVPRNFDIISFICFGRTNIKNKFVPRKYNVNDILYIDKFDTSKTINLAPPRLNVFLRRLARGIYLRLPKFSWIVKFARRFERKF
jgi:nitroreductase